MKNLLDDTEYYSPLDDDNYCKRCEEHNENGEEYCDYCFDIVKNQGNKFMAKETY
jgi:hypothetical protein